MMTADGSLGRRIGGAFPEAVREALGEGALMTLAFVHNANRGLIVIDFEIHIPPSWG